MSRTATRSTFAQWLGTLPTSWQISRPKVLFSERRTASHENDVHLTPSQTYGVLPQTAYMEITGNRVVLNLQGADAMKHVEPDDFVIHLRSFQGGVEHSGIAGKVSVAYTVLTPREGVEPRFFRWVLKSQGYVQSLQATVNQLRDGQSIKYGDFDKVPLPLPPLEDQRAIADFLDKQTSRIDLLIDKQAQLVVTLRERRSAVITRAVTFGLRDSELSPVRSSRLPGLPDGWTDRPIKAFLRSVDSQRIPLSGEERALRQGEYPYYGASGAIDGVNSYIFDEPLVLVSEDGANLVRRTTPIAFETVGKVWVNNHAHALVPRDRTSARFWALRIDSIDIFDLVTGSAQPKFTADALMNMRISAPEIVAEREEIVAYLDEQTARIDAVISKTEEHIALARERRMALITAAVTGQIEGWTADRVTRGVA